jgi:hypothetical protein
MAVIANLTGHERRLQFISMALVVIFGFCLCSWTAFSKPLSGDPRVAAAAFLDNVASNRIDAAYSRTTRTFQNSHNRASFQTMLQQSSWQDAARSWSSRTDGAVKVDVCSRDSTSPYCRVRLAAGKSQILLRMLADGDQWKVSACFVQSYMTE